MNIDMFAAVTQDTISENGFEGFQPTVCFPARRQVRALSGVPDDEAHEPVALRWAAGLAHPGEEYLVAFKVSRAEFKVMRLGPGIQEQHVQVVRDLGPE